jgi:hypothetical protein
MTKALTLHMVDGASHVALVTDNEVDLDDWIEERYEGLQLLGVISVELRGRHSKQIRKI